jgi:hypothetical protein
MAGKKERYAAVPMKKSAMLHVWYKRALCCRAGEKELYAALPVKNVLCCRASEKGAMLHGW